MRALVREWGLVMGFWWWLGESFRGVMGEGG